MVLGIHSTNRHWDFYFMGTKLLLFLYIIFPNLCIIIVMLFALEFIWYSSFFKNSYSICT